jgi:hypothetical protein
MRCLLVLNHIDDQYLQNARQVTLALLNISQTARLDLREVGFHES